MDNDFYIRFENRFRGPRDVIKRRLGVYWPIIQPLKTLYPENKVLDLGCGRGEWLEFLKDKGWPALGVDLNSAMVDCCRSFGLEAEEGDLLHYVFSLPDESQAVISGFHIAEHLAFDDLNRLVHEALRVLKPGGILILETPNPENIIVAACSFYNDPTHRHPLPPSLMAFVAEEADFSSIITLRLNGSEEILAEQEGKEMYAAVVQLFLGQPDYALIAQKKPNADDVELFQHLRDLARIEALQVMSLEEKIMRFGRSIHAQWEKVKSSADIQAFEWLQVQLDAVHSEKAELNRHCDQLESEAKASAWALKQLQAELDAVKSEKADLDRHCRRLELETQSLELQRQAKLNTLLLEKANLEQSCRRLESELRERVQEFDRQRHQLEEAVETARRELHSLLNSTSWRFTRPLRVIKHTLVQGVKWSVKKTLALPIKVVSRTPGLKSFAARQVRRFPGLESRLRRMVPHNATSVTPKVFAMSTIQTGPMAEKVYQDLKRAIENVRGKI